MPDEFTGERRFACFWAKSLSQRPTVEPFATERPEVQQQLADRTSVQGVGPFERDQRLKLRLERPRV